MRHDQKQPFPLGFRVFAFDPERATTYPTQQEILSQVAKLTTPAKQSYAENYTALHMAAMIGCSASLQFYLSLGIDINAKLVDGATAAYFAAQRGHTDILCVLAKCGADLNQKRLDGATPAIIAAAMGHAGVLDILVKHGADINKSMTVKVDDLKQLAQRYNKTSELEKLLESKNLNQAATIASFTPLHMATFCGHLNAVKTLLAARATGSLAQGISPRAIPEAMGRQDMLSWYEETDEPSPTRLLRS